MKEQIGKIASTPAVKELQTSGASDSTASNLSALGTEVVELLYAQAFSPGKLCTVQAICEAFSNILLKHWNLCCLAIFLHGDDGRLSESAVYFHPNLDEEATRRVAALMAAEVERTEREHCVWSEEEGGEADSEMRAALKNATLKAAAAVPIHARGGLVGTLVAVSSNSERLRSALRGLRFIAPPIVIAIGNARRSAAMNEQHQHIEHLVEELKQRSTELEETNRELQRVSRYRSLFLARMSHELRTPLTSVLGFTEILLDQEQLTDTQRRFCEKIQASGLQLQTSVNQLVDLSRLEAGRTELFLHEFSLRETLRESCAAVGRLAQKQGVEIDCRPSGEVGVVVSDEGKLRQVFYNFLAHAIGRSPREGRVVVTAENPSHDCFVVKISDDGEPLLDTTHIFDPVDLDAPSDRGINMTELGLVIAHRLVDALGGHITLDNTAPHGLTVILELPARPKGQ